MKPEQLTLSLQSREIEPRDWRLLKSVLYPNVSSDETLLMVWDYCKCRKLDIFKRPIQIVPIWSKVKGVYEDTIWTSISELRTTATRTGQYAGCSEPEFGPNITEDLGGLTITYPLYCKIIVYRIVQGIKCEFVSKLLWKEAFKKNKDGSPNSMWRERIFAQLEKCCEAAALRKAFPEEIGNDYIAEEAFDLKEVKESDKKTKINPPVPLELPEIKIDQLQKNENKTEEEPLIDNNS